MSTETIDAEVETTAIAVRQPQSLAPTGLFGPIEPVAVIEKATAVASALKDVIRRQGLISNISGKEYPKCEAWTLLGTMLGVFPVLEWCRPVDGGWEARVQAKTRSGDVIGAAEAQCLHSERNWANRDDFALRSMAQTRATAKCLRMPLGFVMTLAGYEATPAEEMVTDHPKQPQAPKAAPSPPQTPVHRSTTEQRAKMIATLLAGEGQPNRDLVTEYFQKAGMLLPNETLEELPLRWVPATQKQMLALNDKIAAFGNGEEAVKPYPANEEAPESKKAVEVPRDGKAPEGEEWRTFPMPWGDNAGQPLEALEKRYLFGLWANYKVETEYQGKPKRPETIAKDTKFREMLDQAGQHYEFKKKD